MSTRNEFLRQCQHLAELGFRPRFEEGMRVARGFADLGFEEFSVVPGEKLVSLFTGSVHDLSDSENLFVVPSCDDMVHELVRIGYDVTELRFDEARTWSLTVRPEGGEPVTFERRSLREVLQHALIAAHGESAEE